MLNHYLFNHQSLKIKIPVYLIQEKERRECPHCHGTGKIQPYGARRFSKCQKCQGTGFISN